MGIETTTTSYGGGDYRWLAEEQSVAVTGTLDVSAFTIANGYIPSGTPVKANAGLLVPADAASSAATLAGFVRHDVAAATGGADQPCAILVDATIVAANVPGTHDLVDGRYIVNLTTTGGGS